MLWKKKKVSGVDLIDSVISRFAEMIDELNEGADCCNDEQIEIQHTMSSLTERNDMLSRRMKRAETIATNLRNLIGGDSF